MSDTPTWPTDEQVEKAARKAILFNGPNQIWEYLPEETRKQFLAIARLALSAVNPYEWRPIETAPKDGTQILAYADRCGWRGFPQMVCAAWYESGNRWYVYGAGPTKHSPQWLDECTPVCWMPLPPSPEGDK